MNELLYQDNLALSAYISATEARARRAYLLKVVEDLDPRQDCDMETKRAELAVLSDAELYAKLDDKEKQAYNKVDFSEIVDITQAVHHMLANEAVFLEQKAEQIALVQNGLQFCRDLG